MTLPLLRVSVAFLGGIVLASLLHFHFLIWLGLAFLGLVGTFMAYRFLPARYRICPRTVRLNIPPRVFLLALASLVSAFLGAARYQLSVPPQSPSHIAWYNDAGYEVLVTGTLIQPPDVRDTYINLRMQARALDAGRGQFAVRGLVLARVAPNQNFHYGEILRLRGRLATPPSNEDFSYREYLARQGIRSYMPGAEATILPGRGGNPVLRAVYALKEVSLGNVYRLFLDPEASLLAGILLGVDTGMPARLEQAFNDTGTAHIIAISGFNIAVVAGVFAFVFNRLLGPRRGALAAFAGITFYTVFVGSDPAVVRAAIMGVVALLAVQVGRRQTGVNTLAFVAALMALWNPFVLWDIGFQLSLLATLGLILYGGRFMDAARTFIERHLPASDARKLASPLGQFVLLTFAAQLTTLPIIAYHFKQISLVSPLANALILPAQPAVMVLGGLALVFSVLIYPLGQLIAWAAWPLTAYTIRVVEFFADLPQAVIYLGSFSLGVVALFYIVLLAVTFAGANLKDLYGWLKARFQHLPLALIIVVLFICTLFALRLASAAADGRLHVTFLDVGSADAVLIESASGGHVLINGGPSAASSSDALGRRLSPIDHRLDWLVVASTDEHQVASLPRLLPRFPPQAVLLGAPEQASFSSAALMEYVKAKEILLTRAEQGQALNLGDGAMLKVMNISSRGATLLLEWNSFRLLLPIGANLDTLAALENGGAVGPMNVLLLAQSGIAPLAPPEWLQNLNPQLVVISVATADRDGLPDPKTLEALEGYSVLRTDQNGWIEIVTDGAQMWVSSERPLKQSAP
ncbi:MAG: ComEC/Rec2 family competence protein [Chloroflexota bacterium]